MYNGASQLMITMDLRSFVVRSFENCHGLKAIEVDKQRVTMKISKSYLDRQRARFQDHSVERTTCDTVTSLHYTDKY